VTGISVEIAIQETLEMSCLDNASYKIIAYKTSTYLYVVMTLNNIVY